MSDGAPLRTAADCSLGSDAGVQRAVLVGDLLYAVGARRVQVQDLHRLGVDVADIAIE